MLLKSDWNFVALLLPVFWRLALSLPAVRARKRCWDTLIASMVDYQLKGEAYAENHLATINRLELEFYISNRRTATTWNALKIIGITWVITLIGFFDLLALSIDEHGFTISSNVSSIKTDTFSSIMVCLFVLEAAGTYFWMAKGHKPLPDIDYVKQFEDFLKSERSTKRRREQTSAQQGYNTGSFAPNNSVDPQAELRILFGLGDKFSKADLQRARRRLAAFYHPDRWLHATSKVRAEKENEFKLINAAYEQLKPFAS
ncbi:MAG: hypothetical protein WBQ49_02130 [Rhodomicrobium sp.]